ncbi:MAG TPA: hypothetical protein VFC31_13495 [Candidatus Limnocylindria bacterium]|nr:hypothetical protein [Candidatus Limnocylindria bacterium]
MADLSSFTNTELRALATRQLVECCDECRVMLREQLIEEENSAARVAEDSHGE